MSKVRKLKNETAIKSNKDSVLVSVQDASKESGLPVQTLWRLLKAKRLPSVCFGRRKYIKRTELMAFIDENVA